VNLSFGIYDFFVGIIPGALYLAVGVYLALRFGWVGTDDLTGLNTALALTGGMVVAYLLGQLVAPSLMVLTDRLPLWRSTHADAQAVFARRNPGLADRPYISSNIHTLYAAVHMAAPTLGERIDRSRATGIMLRSIVPAGFIAAAIALVEAALGPTQLGLGAAGALVGMALLALKEGRKFGLWARLSTLEAAAFVPDADLCADPPDITKADRQGPRLPQTWR
jgi:hypothetical protein